MRNEETFRGALRDREAGLAACRRRTEEVRAVLPAERLLIFVVAEDWGPLRAVLGVAVPDEPFPHRNLRGDFGEVLGADPPEGAAPAPPAPGPGAGWRAARTAADRGARMSTRTGVWPDGDPGFPPARPGTAPASR